MVFAADGDGVISRVEFKVLGAYSFLANDMERYCRTTDSDGLGNYKLNFILPHNYTSELHREMLEYDNGHLVSVADYYAMCSDSIRSRFGIDHMGFMMQLCLLHCVLDFDGENSTGRFLARKAEELAGAIPQFTDRAICHHAVDVYRRFVIEHEGNVRMDAEASTPGDSLFQSLKRNMPATSFTWISGASDAGLVVRECSTNAHSSRNTKMLQSVFSTSAMKETRHANQARSSCPRIKFRASISSFRPMNGTSSPTSFSSTPFPSRSLSIGMVTSLRRMEHLPQQNLTNC